MNLALIVIMAVPAILILMPLFDLMRVNMMQSQRAGIFRYIYPDREGQNYADRMAIKRFSR